MTKKMHSSKNGQINIKAGDSFSIFFHAASNEKKTAVFIKVAEKANKDQRDLVKCVNLRLKSA